VKRQSSKTQLVVSGIFCAALLAVLAAVFFQFNLIRVPSKQPTIARIDNVPPLPGHWLKTAQENWYIPAQAESYQIKTAVQQEMKSPKVLPVYSLESARTSLNRGLDSINVLYVWSDADQLKVISITSFNLATRQAAIVVIPLSTVVNAGEYPASQEKWITVQDIYREQGRDGIKALLEEKLEMSIPSYVHVNQAALQQLSEIVGELTVNGDEITMLDAFEQTASGIRKDDRDVVRAVASRILRPQMLAEVPRLLWIFTHEVKTNLSAEEMIKMFNLSRQMDLSNMQKTALPGYEYLTESSKFVLVSEQTWKNIIYEITN
jgi:anionic cell wall polymer biosynthesis LytR-Cps2A-Psr (LCP) family protein